jgi:hypothetical protein
MKNEMDYAMELYDIIDEFQVPCASEEQEKFLVSCVFYCVDITLLITFTLNSCRSICLD